MLASLFLVPGCQAQGSAPAPDAEPSPSFDLRLGVRIPMRDGIELHATLYVPDGLTAKAPAVLNMTPYSSDGFHREASALARRGFVFAALDVRGRGNSAGRFEPWRNDGRDGHDAVEWLARQPWSNGKVGMMGHSYGGRAVWSTLKEAPPHLAAALPLSASFPMLSWNNVMTPEGMQWVVLTSGVTGNSRLLADSRFWREKFRELYLSGRPLRELDRVVGFRSDTWQSFLDHPTLDDYWTSVTPTAEDFGRLSLPILTVTAANEANAAPLWYYEEHVRHASPQAVSSHFVVIGPWDHRGVLRPWHEVGGLVFGPASQVDMTGLIGDWFDFTLRGGPRPAFLEAPVRYYMAGPEEWRNAGTLAETAGPRRTFWLASDGDVGTLERPGTLADAKPGAGHDAWTYDSLDARPASHGIEEVENWLTEHDLPNDLFGAGAVYVTAPFSEPVDLVGRSRLSAWLEVDVPDTDVVARLDLLTPEGSTVLLGEDWMRARFRLGLEREELVGSGEPFELRFVFPWVARTLPEGSRLRLVLRSPSSIFLSRNFNSARPVADQSARDARTAHVRLLHGAAGPSRLTVPLRSGSVGARAGSGPGLPPRRGP